STAACGSRSPHSARADAAVLLFLHLSRGILQRFTDGFVRAVPGVFSVELAGPHSFAVLTFVRWREPAGGGGDLAWAGRHGARLRYWQLHAGTAAQRRQ